MNEAEGINGLWVMERVEREGVQNFGSGKVGLGDGWVVRGLGLIYVRLSLV